MDPESPSIASPNPAPDDSQRDVDTSPFSDKQHTATPNIMNMPDIEVNDGFGDLGQPEGSPIGKNDERESNADRRAIYDQWDQKERRMKTREAEGWSLKRTAPIQAHLHALHEAYRNVDPEYTVFAFGGTIPANEIDAGKLTLHVASRVSVDEAGSRFDGQMRKKGGCWPKEEERNQVSQKVSL